MVVGVSWSGAAWVLPTLGSYSSLREPWTPTCTVTYRSRAWFSPFRTGRQGSIPTWQRLQTHFQDDHCLAKEDEGKGNMWGILKRKVEEHKVSNIHQLHDVVMESGRGLQCQPVKLWWTPFPRGLRQSRKIMVATQNIDTLGHFWTFSLRGILTFVTSSLDINGSVLSYFERTANLHCYTSCTLTTLHCSSVFCEILYITCFMSQTVLFHKLVFF